MRALLQRVTQSKVEVKGKTVGEISKGLTIFFDVGTQDTKELIPKMVDKIINLRIFEDAEGKMNQSLLDIKGDILLISQFTLYANCKKGRRPSFIEAADPEIGNALYEQMIHSLREQGITVATGIFGADMQVTIHNDGPVTILLDSDEL